MKSPLVLLAIVLVLAATPCVASEPVPPFRPPDSVPNPWKEFNIDWKETWDQTLSANYNPVAWKTALEQDEALCRATDLILRLRQIELLEAMIRRFPGETQKRVEAYRTISQVYMSLGDRTRAAQWLMKLISDFPGQNAAAVDAYTGILRYAHPFDAMPDTRLWIDYAARGLGALEKAGAVPRDHPAAVLAKRHACLVLVHEHRYEEASRLLDRLKAAEGDQQWWLTERAALMEAAGHFAQAAELYEKAGNSALAASLRDRLGQSIPDDISRRPSQDLHRAWEELRGRAKLAGQPAFGDPTLVQRILELSTETGATERESDSSEVSSWIVADRMLRSLQPAEILPVRQMQDQSAGNIADRVLSSGDLDEAMWRFRRYPWAHSVHELLVDLGEAALREGRPHWAVRAFQDVMMRTDDPKLLAQARVGLWLALAQLEEERGVLDKAMADVPDGAPLPWQGVMAPSADIKQSIRSMVPAAGAPLEFSRLPRLQLRLPAALAGDEPVSHSPHLAGAGLGPWAIRRIEASGNLLCVLGHRQLACYDAKTMALRWVNSDSRAFYSPSEEQQRSRGSSGPSSAQPARRGVTLGTIRSSALVERWRPGTGTAPLRALCVLLSRADDKGASYDVAAFEASTDRVLWTTKGRAEWSALEPLNEPAAAEGRVYVMAAGLGTVFLVCLDGGDGRMLWKRPLGMLPANAQFYDLARAGSAVTVHQGAVYVSSSLGVVARCDARDGMVEWLRTYAGAVQNDRLGVQFRREGTPPLVAGERVLVAPRDHSGVIALDRTTGQLAWETFLVPSGGIIGATDKQLVLQGEGSLAALDLDSGSEIWVRAIDGMEEGVAVVAGPQVLVVSGGKASRVAAATGAVIEEMPLSRGPGTGHVVLPDASIVEVTEETQAPAAERGGVQGPLGLPLVKSWSLRCGNPLLILPGEHGPPHMFGVLSGRSVWCILTQPECRVAWQTRLTGYPDSVGFHGNLCLVARGRELTALDSSSGATRWSVSLPFGADVVGGDERIIFAAELSTFAKVAAFAPDTGRMLWHRWFGQEARFGGRLSWISVQPGADGAPSLGLYWNATLFGKEGNLPAEVVVDGLSGDIRDVRPFLPNGPEWPSHIVFGDDTRTYLRESPFYPWARQGPFRGDTIACVGKDLAVRFILRGQQTDLAPGWTRTADLQPVSQYPSIAGLHTTASGPYVKRVGELVFFDAATKKEVLYELPWEPNSGPKRAILDFRETGGTLMVVSGVPPPPPASDRSGLVKRGLRDDTGCGNVTLSWFGPQAQVGNFARGFPEAGSNAVATLLNGTTKEHYHDQTLTMSGVSSLGWSKYDVYLYGFSGKATINGGDPQTCSGMNSKEPSHRTTFIRGVNYVKFTGVTGDSFTLNFTQSDFSAIQIVDASPQPAEKTNRAGLGVNWTGSGLALRPTDRVGAEVASASWYNINGYNLLLGGPAGRADGLPAAVVHLFDRNTGQLLQTQALPGVQPMAPGSAYGNHARVLDDALVVTDGEGVHVFRSGSPGAK